MRGLTFRGYLESYVRGLAGRDTLSLSKLASLLPSEPRLAEPLVLLAVKSGHADSLSTLLRDRAELHRELRTLASLERHGKLESALDRSDSRLRPEYSKVWSSYVVRRDAPMRDALLKLEARKRVLELEATTGVSRYRMAKDLGLNPGNLHAFLAQGNASKISLDRALDLVNYLEAA